MRDWLRAFGTRAEAIRSHFTRLAALIDPQLPAIEPRASPVADAFAAIEAAHQAAQHRFGDTPLWRFVSAATSGRLINNTNPPFAELPPRALMPETDPPRDFPRSHS